MEPADPWQAVMAIAPRAEHLVLNLSTAMKATVSGLLVACIPEVLTAEMRTERGRHTGKPESWHVAIVRHGVSTILKPVHRNSAKLRPCSHPA